MGVFSKQLVDNNDIGSWRLHKSGQFSVRSMYLGLLDDRVLPLNKPIWKVKIPLKVNLARRNWKGCKQCCFCNNDETIAHLFFECHIARLLWQIIFVTFGIHKPTNLSICLGLGYKAYNGHKRILFFQVYVSYIGQFGCQEMMLYSKKLKNKLVFRSFLGPHIEQGHG